MFLAVALPAFYPNEHLYFTPIRAQQRRDYFMTRVLKCINEEIIKMY